MIIDDLFEQYPSLKFSTEDEIIDLKKSFLLFLSMPENQRNEVCHQGIAVENTSLHSTYIWLPRVCAERGIFRMTNLLFLVACRFSLDLSLITLTMSSLECWKDSRNMRRKSSMSSAMMIRMNWRVWVIVSEKIKEFITNTHTAPVASHLFISSLQRSLGRTFGK